MSISAPFISLGSLLHPLPEQALEIFLHVLQTIPAPLAAPFVQTLLRKHSFEPSTTRDVDNVLYKLRGALLLSASDKQPCQSLKPLQAACPDHPTILIDESRKHCLRATCTKPLRTERVYEIFAQQLPQGMLWETTCQPTRFRVFTLQAGIQFASFAPKRCVTCGDCYIGGWAYRASRNCITECRWVGPHPDRYFVIPKMRSWLAVDTGLLQMIDSQVLLQKASFQSAFRVWTRMHREEFQQELLHGGLGTLERNNTQRLEEAWFAWSATRLAESHDADILWDFSSPSAFDSVLLQYDPVLRESHFQSVANHIPDCPRCQHLLGLVSDGKKGAARRVCANMNKFRFIPELQVAIHTGCESHVDSNHFHCMQCEVELSASPSVHIDAHAEKVLEARTVREGDELAIHYMLKFKDGYARLLPRAMVPGHLLRSFEIRRKLAMKTRKRRLACRVPAKMTKNMRKRVFGSRRKKLPDQRDQRPRKRLLAVDNQDVVAAQQTATHASSSVSIETAVGATSVPSSALETGIPEPIAGRRQRSRLPLPKVAPRMRITKEKHVRRYGATPGCDGCLLPANHKEDCRERMENAMRSAYIFSHTSSNLFHREDVVSHSNVYSFHPYRSSRKKRSLDFSY